MKKATLLVSLSLCSCQNAELRREIIDTQIRVDRIERRLGLDRLPGGHGRPDVQPDYGLCGRGQIPRLGEYGETGSVAAECDSR